VDYKNHNKPMSTQHKIRNKCKEKKHTPQPDRDHVRTVVHYYCNNYYTLY